MWQVNNELYAVSTGRRPFHVSCEPHWRHPVPPLLSHSSHTHVTLGWLWISFSVVWSQQHGRNREGRKKLWCLHISDKWWDAQFALITTLNTETHVIALMLLWCLQIIVLTMYTVSRSCLGFAHWPVCVSLCVHVCVGACVTVSENYPISYLLWFFCLGSHPKGLI